MCPAAEPPPNPPPAAGRPSVVEPVAPLGDWIRASQRPIAAALRDVESASRQNCHRDEFFALLLQRTVSAMGARGGILWHRESENEAGRFVSLARAGHLTDQALADTVRPVHDRLLRQVAADGKPVVVPPSPGATRPDLPANPLDVPAAIVPLRPYHDQSPTHFLLQLFLAPASGIAARRGYLRFAAQMGGFAEAFLRAEDHLGGLHYRKLSTEILDNLLTLHRPAGPDLAPRIARTTADLFGFSAVSLIVIGDPDGGSARQSGSACYSLLAHYPPDPTPDPTPDATPASTWLATDALVSIARHATATTWLRPDRDPVDRATAVLIPSPGSGLRLIARDRAGITTRSPQTLGLLRRWTRHCDLLLRQAPRPNDADRKWDRQRPGHPGPSNRRVARFLGVAAAAALTCGFAAGVALMAWRAPGTPAAESRAADAILVAPRDGLISAVHVGPDRPFAAGDRLLTINDPSLESEIADLRHRQAMLIDRQRRRLKALANGTRAGHPRPFSFRDDNDRLRRLHATLLAEHLADRAEIRSLDQAIGRRGVNASSLTLHADRRGTITAADLDRLPVGRQVRQGDVLLRIRHEPGDGPETRPGPSRKRSP